MPIPSDPHPDPFDGPEADRLLRALRGDGTDPVLARVGRALRDLGPADTERMPPPVDLWSQIEAARTGDAGGAAGVGGGSPSVTDAGEDLRPLAPVIPLRRRWVPAAGVAATVLLLAGAAAVFATGGPSEEGDVVAIAELDALQGSTTARAEVLDTDDGRFLDLDLTGFDAGEGRYLEVWLLTPDVSGLVSLGPVQPDGTYPVPPGVDLDEYGVVDVSYEPVDGNPAHSGDSVLRGPLDFTV
jgi:hypothetical protein